MTDYVRKGNPKSRNRIFIVHRLDRETSGVLIFAKNEEAKLRLQENWDDTTKKYLAVVHGKAPKRASLSPTSTKARFTWSALRAIRTGAVRADGV